ncbi:MAG: hypothetical protein P8177_07320, partial [Gemmatimonadota bacterium]
MADAEGAIRRAGAAAMALPVLLVAGAGSAAGQRVHDLTLLPPPPGDGPVVVETGFYLNDVNTIDLQDQRFVVQGILTLTWYDERLAFDPEEVGVDEIVYQGDYQFSEVGTGWWPQMIIINESGPYLRQGQLLRQRHDGRMTYLEGLNAGVEVPAELRRFPFEHEHFEIAFGVLGFDRTEVRLVPDSASSGHRALGLTMSGWDLRSFEVISREHDPVYADDHVDRASTVVVRLELARRPGFMIRVVVFPMMLLVALSWSIFWMDRESLGDRMSISFLGIVSIVAYQVMVASRLPAIPYFTMLSAFIYISFVTMCASVVVNLT